MTSASASCVLSATPTLQVAASAMSIAGDLQQARLTEVRILHLLILSTAG